MRSQSTSVHARSVSTLRTSVAESLWLRVSSSSASLPVSGATDSAAAVGVEARRSLTMSQIEVSGS